MESQSWAAPVSRAQPAPGERTPPQTSHGRRRWPCASKSRAPIARWCWPLPQPPAVPPATLGATDQSPRAVPAPRPPRSRHCCTWRKDLQERGPDPSVSVQGPHLRNCPSGPGFVQHCSGHWDGGAACPLPCARRHCCRPRPQRRRCRHRDDVIDFMGHVASITKVVHRLASLPRRLRGFEHRKFIANEVHKCSGVGRTTVWFGRYGHVALRFKRASGPWQCPDRRQCMLSRWRR